MQKLIQGIHNFRCEEFWPRHGLLEELANLSHLPLNDVSANLERNLLAPLNVTGNAGVPKREAGQRCYAKSDSEVFEFSEM